MEHRAVDLDERLVRAVAHGMDGLGHGAFAHAGLAGDEDIGSCVGGVLHQRPQPLHGLALPHQVGGSVAGAQLGNFLGIVGQRILHLLEVPVDGVDLLHRHGVEAHRVFQVALSVKQGDAHGHHIGVGVVDGLGGGDLLLGADDLRRDAGGKGAVRLQIKGRLAHNRAVGEAEVLLICFADLQNGAVGVREHHIVRQHQIVLGAENFKQVVEIDVLREQPGERILGHGHPPSYSQMSIAYSRMNRKRENREFYTVFRRCILPFFKKHHSTPKRRGAKNGNMYSPVNICPAGRCIFRPCGSKTVENATGFWRKPPKIF